MKRLVGLVAALAAFAAGPAPAQPAFPGRTVTIVVHSNAAGGFNAVSPCYKTASDTAVCPTSFAPNKIVKRITVSASVGDNDVTIDTPSLSAWVYLGNGDDTVSVPHCTTSIISASGGDDVIYGGSGADTIYADGGTDYVYVYSSPAAADTVYCGSSSVDLSPSDTVIVDGSDTVNYSSNCLSVRTGP